MSTRNISWGLKAAGAWGWQPFHLHVPIVLKSGSLNLLEPSGPVQVCTGIALPVLTILTQTFLSFFLSLCSISNILHEIQTRFQILLFTIFYKYWKILHIFFYPAHLWKFCFSCKQTAITDMPKQVSMFESKPLCENLFQTEGWQVIRVLRFSHYVNCTCHVELYGTVLALGELEKYNTVSSESADHSFVWSLNKADSNVWAANVDDKFHSWHLPDTIQTVIPTVIQSVFLKADCRFV